MKYLGYVVVAVILIGIGFYFETMVWAKYCFIYTCK